MTKYCIVSNYATHYRQPVFTLIDSEWDCDWYFSKNKTDIPEMDLGLLKNVTLMDDRHPAGLATWQNGVGRLIRDPRYTRYLMLGEPATLSTWWVLVQRRLFRRDKRIYLWTHGWYGREGFAKKWIKRLFFGMADHVFTYGEYARGQASLQGFDPSKITPIHNSLDHARQLRIREALTPEGIYSKHFGNDRPTLIFIGRLTSVKRLDMILGALDILKKQGLDYNLTIVGTGEKHRELEEKTQRLGLADRVWFYGPCFDEERNARLIYEADLCVSPGNVGLTSIHSMTFGTPVLSHDDFKWQMPEFEAIRPGKTGAFFRHGDTEALARGINEWFATHPDRETVREECFREIDSNWTPEYQIEVLRKVFG